MLGPQSSAPIGADQILAAHPRVDWTAAAAHPSPTRSTLGSAAASATRRARSTQSRLPPTRLRSTQLRTTRPRSRHHATRLRSTRLRPTRLRATRLRSTRLRSSRLRLIHPTRLRSRLCATRLRSTLLCSRAPRRLSTTGSPTLSSLRRWVSRLGAASGWRTG
jgi:hypothetical protein